MTFSWRLLPTGTYVPLSATQDLLIDSAALRDDFEDVRDHLTLIRGQLNDACAEARRLVSACRRERLRLRVIPGGRVPRI
jgi:hypothetical protein